MPGKKKPPAHRLRDEKPMMMRRGSVENSIDSFNNLAIWNGEIRYSSIDFKGQSLAFTTTQNLRIRLPFWEMFCFSKGQAAIAAVTGIGIPRPLHGQVIDEWQDMIIMGLAIARKKGLPDSSPGVKEHIRHWLAMAWFAAEQPQAKNTVEFIDFMRAIKRTRRNPARGTIPPVVFIAEECTWVHVPSFIAWVSIPSIADQRITPAEVREGLDLLDFQYRENLSRGFDGDSEICCLWQGPLQALD